MRDHAARFLVGLAVAAIGCEQSPTAPSVSFRRITEGSFGRLSEPGVQIVSDRASWDALLAQLTPQRPPESVDFSSESAVVVFLGARPTGGYAVRVEGVAASPSRVEVQAVEETPHPTCGVIQAVTQPFAIIAIARSATATAAVEWTRLPGRACQ